MTSTIKFRPVGPTTLLLKFFEPTCKRVIARLYEDGEGDLFCENNDRLNDLDPEGTWFADDKVDLIVDFEQYLELGCPRSSPGCGVFYSRQLGEYRVELAKARGTGKPVTVRL